MIFKHKWGSFLPLFFILSCVMFSCTHGVVVHSYTHVPQQWKTHDTLTISLPDSLPAGAYSMRLETRNTVRYAYRDLWLLMYTSYENEATTITSADTLHLYLTDERGNWQNPNTIGAHYQAEHPLQKSLIVNENSSHYRLQFRQMMNDSILYGLTDIGICLYK